MAKKARARTRVTWYGVKSLYRWHASGRPRAKDARFDARVSLVEERVVLFQARTFGEAIRAAEKEARAYVKGKHVNPYGQQVRIRYLGAVDAFQMFGPPGRLVEVFSNTELVPKRVPDRVVVDRRMGS